MPLSVVAIIFMLIVRGFIILVLFGVGSRRYRVGILIVSSCSSATATACHPKPEENDRDIAVLLLMYEEVSREDDRIGHAFSCSEEVRPLQDARLYQ